MKIRLIFGACLVIAGAAGAMFIVRKTAPPNYSNRPTVENFVLLDHLGRAHELYRYRDKKAIVIIAQGTGCPIIQKSYPLIKTLVEKYSESGIEFLLFNASSQDTRSALQKEAVEFGINVPILKDRAQIIVDSLGFTRTTEAVVIVPEKWKMVYRGAIADYFDYSGKSSSQRIYLDEVLGEILSNKRVSVAETEAKGCALEQDERLIAFSEVAPIFKKRCLYCHGTLGIRPTNMHTESEIKGWSAMIREVIRTDRMPPWAPDPEIGKLILDGSLQPTEAHALVKWIEQGAHFESDRKPVQLDDPKPIEFGPPDLELIAQAPQTLMPEQPSGYYAFDLGRAAKEIRIKRIMMRDKGASRAAHHFELLYSDTPLSTELASKALDQGNSDLILASNDAMQFPPGTYYSIPKDSFLYIRGHYEATGKPERIQPRAKIWFAKPTDRLKQKVVYITKPRFKIPPGQVVTLKSQVKTLQPVYLSQCGAHMHWRGTAAKISVRSGSGPSIPIISFPRMTPARQRTFAFKDLIYLNEGSSIEAELEYDNTANNPLNPDPAAWVNSGPFLANEMFRVKCFYQMDPEQSASDFPVFSQSE